MSDKSTDIAAEKVHVSGKTMRDAKVVASDGTEEEKQAVINGEISVNKVAAEVRQWIEVKKYAETPEFNRTNDATIEWAKYTWNPVTMKYSLHKESALNCIKM